MRVLLFCLVLCFTCAAVNGSVGKSHRFLDGTDDCPGLRIPDGTYTSELPYIVSGDTTLANNTMWNLPFHELAGPDHLYSFAIKELGPNPQIQLTTTSSTYDASLSILNPLQSNCLEGGEGVTAFLMISTFTQFGGGGVRTLSSAEISSLPRNQPLTILVDSWEGSGPISRGPYTLRLQDMTLRFPKRMVSVEGRVVHQLNGQTRPLRGVTVTLTDKAGLRRSTQSSALGYYAFEGLEEGSYSLSATSKKFRFATQELLMEKSREVDLVGIE
jgi:hypothetical protein